MKSALLFFLGLSITGFSHADDQPPARIMVNQSGQGVALTGANRADTYGPRFVASYEDKSVWYFGEKFSEEKQPEAFYCWIDELDNPKCKRVWVDISEPKPKKN
tara:strand:+ start:845 stop:1156 length:312 start_codon:yes stop_codon:yes gene_type:complete